jgi:hypothetical protein
MLWPMGKIVEITKGRDHQVCSLLLEMKNSSLTRRDIWYCYQMEEVCHGGQGQLTPWCRGGVVLTYICIGPPTTMVSQVLL